ADITAAKEAARTLQAQNSLLKSENDRLKKQLADLNEAIKKAKTAPVQVKTEVKTVVDTKAIDELKKQNSDLQKQLADAKKSVPSAPAVDTEKVKKLEKALADLEKDLNAARTKITEREQTISKLQNDLTNMRETMDKLAKDSSAAAKAEMTKLREDNLKLNETIRSLRNEKTTAGENLIQTKKELLSVKAQLEKLRSEVTADVKGKKLAAELDAMTQKAEKLEKAHSTTQVSLERLKQEKAKLSSQNSQLEKQLDAALRKTNLLQAEIQKWSAGNDTVVKGKMAEKDKVIDQIMKEHMAQAQEIERLKGELENAETLAAAARKDAIKAREDLEEIKELQRTTEALKQTVTTGIRITPSGKKVDTPAPAPVEKTVEQQQTVVVQQSAPAPAPVVTPEPEKPALAPEVLKQYNDAFAEAEKQEKAGELDEAMWKYLIAADLNPDAWQPHMAMSRLYLKAEKADKAKQEYEKALRLGMSRNKEHEATLDQAIQKVNK
ncbi:MAG: hypothetical protein J6C30_01140, partial [Lentisphaeria bacterium]|nr:hypothetical protein [Lentisphaeria bacterium]